MRIKDLGETVVSSVAVGRDRSRANVFGTSDTVGITLILQQQAEWDTSELGNMRMPLLSPSTFLRGIATNLTTLDASNALAGPQHQPASNPLTDGDVGGGETFFRDLAHLYHQC